MLLPGSSGLCGVTNVDRTARNTNMLIWHRQLWLIDHGATLYLHHSPGWESEPDRARRPFSALKDHVLLRYATMLNEVDENLSRALTNDIITGILDFVPDRGCRARARRCCRLTCAVRIADIWWTGSSGRGSSSRRPCVPAEYTYDYAIVRIVPRVERGERMNVGVILSCPDLDFSTFTSSSTSRVCSRSIRLSISRRCAPTWQRFLPCVEAVRRQGQSASWRPAAIPVARVPRSR